MLAYMLMRGHAYMSDLTGEVGCIIELICEREICRFKSAGWLSQEVTFKLDYLTESEAMLKKLFCVINLVNRGVLLTEKNHR
jgi:hypothetical protein